LSHQAGAGIFLGWVPKNLVVFSLLAQPPSPPNIWIGRERGERGANVGEEPYICLKEHCVYWKEP